MEPHQTIANQQEASSMIERLLKKSEVEQLTSLSASEIVRQEKAGTFPKRIKIGAQRSAWVGSEIDAWIQAKIKTARSEG
jgi:prophage regulatory protein